MFFFFLWFFFFFIFDFSCSFLPTYCAARICIRVQLSMFLSVVGASMWSCGVLTTLGGIAGFGSGHLPGRESMIQLSGSEMGGSSRRKRIVAKENGASLDWFIVTVQSLVNEGSKSMWTSTDDALPLTTKLLGHTIDAGPWTPESSDPTPRITPVSAPLGTQRPTGQSPRNAEHLRLKTHPRTWECNSWRLRHLQPSMTQELWVIEGSWKKSSEPSCPATNTYDFHLWNKIKKQRTRSSSLGQRRCERYMNVTRNFLYGASGPTVSEDGRCRASDTCALQGYVQMCMRSTLCSGDRHTTGIPTKSWEQAKKLGILLYSNRAHDSSHAITPCLGNKVICDWHTSNVHSTFGVETRDV